MKKQYIFIILLGILLFLLFQIVKFKFHEYQIYKYKQEIEAINEQYSEKISLAQKKIEKINSKAYINKMLKSQQGLKSPGEEVITLISEDTYKTYRENKIMSFDDGKEGIYIDPLSPKSLIQTMTVYQKWIYLILGKDIR